MSLRRSDSYEHVRGPPLPHSGQTHAPLSRQHSTRDSVAHQGSSGFVTSHKKAEVRNNSVTDLLDGSAESLFLPIEYISITAHQFLSQNVLLFCALSILSCGILPLVCRFRVEFWTYLIRTKTTSFRDADYVLVEGRDGKYEEIKVVRLKAKMDLESAGGFKLGPRKTDFENERSGLMDECVRVFSYFEYKKQRYVFREGTGSFLVNNLFKL
jgi:hypothetical protein